jgi:predicted ATPase with chaperone activity
MSCCCQKEEPRICGSGPPEASFQRGQLAPADLPKNAGGFDLPIALRLLVATGQLRPEQLCDFATVGELALDGSLRPVKGALSMAMAAAEQGVARLLVPAANLTARHASATP